jgi:hypothetical protein
VPARKKMSLIDNLDRVMQTLVDEGMGLAELIDQEGLEIAHRIGLGPMSTAVMLSAALKNIRMSTRELLDLDVKETAVLFEGNYRLICRYISIEGSPLILVVLVNPQLRYRRLINNAVKQIRGFLDGR